MKETALLLNQLCSIVCLCTLDMELKYMIDKAQRAYSENTGHRPVHTNNNLVKRPEGA
jgi:hypothetical protein